MSYEQILNMMKDFAADHKQVRCFGYGNISDIEVPVDPTTGQPVQRDYAYLFLNPTNHSITNGTITYRFNVIVMDLASELQPTGFSGLNSTIKAQSDALLIINDLLAWIEYNTDYDTELVQNTSITPFKERFNDTVAGMTATLEFVVPNRLNLCDAPMGPDYELVMQRRTASLHTLDFDGYPDNEDNFWNYFEYSYDGITWASNPSAVNGLTYHSFQCQTSGYYRIEFNNICKFNEPEDGSGILKYNIDLNNVPVGSVWTSQMSNIPWVSDNTIVNIDGVFQGHLTAGTEYYFYIGQGYATMPTADEIGVQQIGSTVKVYKRII